MKNHFKLEAVLGASLLSALSHGVFLERVASIGVVVFIFWLTELLRFVFRRQLSVAFQIPFILIVAATFLQLARIQFGFTSQSHTVFLLLPVFLLSVAHGTWNVRTRLAFQYVLCSTVLILLQESVGCAPDLVAFLGVAAGSWFLRHEIFSIVRKPS